MNTAAPTRPSLFAHVLDSLGADIVRGNFDATGLLPREQDLCEALGVSRTVVREAVRVLGQKGLLRAQQKIGVRILPQASWNLLDIDVLDWIWRGGRHEPYVRDFLEFRLTFEPVASRQAATRASAETQGRILDLCEHLVEANERLQAGGSRPEAIDADVAFHTAIFAASGNRLARYLGQLVTHMMRRQVEATTDPPQEFARGLHLHRAVAEAIAERRAEDAFRFSRELVEMPYRRYMRIAFPDDPGEPIV